MYILNYLEQNNFQKKIHYFEFFKKYQYAKKFRNTLKPQNCFIEDFEKFLDIFKLDIKPDIHKDFGGEVFCFNVPKELIRKSQSIKNLTNRMNKINKKKYGLDYYHFTYTIRLRRKNSINSPSKIHENILNNLHLDQYKGVQAIISLNDWKNNIGATALSLEPIKDNPFLHAIRLYNLGKDSENTIDLENIGPITTAIGKELSDEDVKSFMRKRLSNNKEAGNGFIFDGFHYPHMGGVWVNEDRISLHVQSYGMIFGRLYLIKSLIWGIIFFAFRSIKNIRYLIKKTFTKYKR